MFQSPSQGSGRWVKGPAPTPPLFLAAENELLNKVTVPAHFVALNGDRLNINLKTGPEVRVSGLLCCETVGFPWGTYWTVSLPPPTLPAFSICP